MDEPFHIKYRPTQFKEVVGQKEVVKSLQDAIAKSNPHSFLFTGPSGCGKTTLARILAKSLDCLPSNTIEADAATNTGIDAMREITSTLRYEGFGETPNKMIILDECHALSTAAWNSLLKSVEEPPPHVFFAFCTTNPSKVPSTIVTRCHAYNLKPVRYDDLMDLLEMVAEEERSDVSDEILEMVARSCDGSPRQALVMLSMVMGSRDLEEARRLLEAPMESKEVIDLCRLLLERSLDWSKVQETLAAIPEQSPESIRIIMVNYLAAVLMKEKNSKKVLRLLDYLYALRGPFNQTDKLAPLLLALGECIYKD